MFTLLNSTEWASWRADHQTLIQDLLTDLYVDQGSTAEFMDFATAGYTGLQVTAQGLWLVDVMELPSQFNKSKLAAYLSGEQTDGGFSDNVITTFHVTEALSESGYLGSIDTSELSTWLSDCLITSGETSDPDRWGAVGKNPTSIDPRNSYAIGYLQSLSMLGQSHNDPVKLTNWIMTRTANPDGSFSNSLTAYMEPVKGTASALSSMEIMGTLGTTDKTAGLTWFQNNQLDSGGFGWLGDGEDLAGKTEETSLVALSLDLLSETEGTLAVGIIEFVGDIETPVGFEGIELLPSMLWGSWLSQSARFSHSGNQVDADVVSEYLDYFSDLRAYPSWSNLTVYNTPENGWDQYRTKSVWFQYLGLSMAEYVNYQLSSEIEADAEGFIVLSQYFTGHFRPATASGTAHMQHSAAAVEALYMLDSLDSMNYRSALETEVMNDYSAGSWSATGWTLNPFAGTQQAIDWLSTRTALRLGLIDSAMASEISAVINSRIQYEDLWALSRDVATLALLNQAFSVNLEAIDGQLVLDALGPTPFADGWFNSSKLWQPVFTADVLEMLSILGLRIDICDASGNAISASVVGIPEIGSAMDIAVIINSPDSVHSLYVNAFDQWTLFDDVSNTDTVSIPVLDDYSALGPVNISFMIWNYGNSRGYDLAETSISGSFTGDLTIETP
ncbi:MAG: prenyltransferase/squalene oxidase repeat-containing protein, partial [Candidatus Thorarchaeota archaeon]